jgi:hypothetical protein
VGGILDEHGVRLYKLSFKISAFNLELCASQEY